MLEKNDHVHLIGIGGVSMSGIAKILANRGFKVSGSDLNESKYFNLLKEYNIKLYLGHNKSQIENADLIVKTSAIPETNPEIMEAKNKGIKIVKRAEILAYLMRNKKTLAVAGTHGKTTVTAMLAAIFKKADKDPAVMVGGYLKELAGNIADGEGEFFITEADESDGSFLYFDPFLLILNNLELDHPAYYKDFNQFKNIFKKFADKNDKKALLLYNKDDSNLKELLKDRNNKINFSLKKGNYTAKNIKYNNFQSSFDLYLTEKFIGKLKLSVPGEYNLYNALAAAAAAHKLEIDFEAIKKALKNFTGVGRRFEFKGSLENKADIIDDYAHHPTEIKELLKAVKEMDYRKITVVFQPHRYSRTNKFYKEFALAFKNADQVYLSSVFSASEKEELIFPMTTFADLIAEKSEVECSYISDFVEISKQLKFNLIDKEIILIVGAGNITDLSNILLNN